ncbi:MAG: hypothetical protein QOG82_1890 [Actinomycetota bacterium]|nr:hypothetical protein [Actinomycetota bacterium]
MDSGDPTPAELQALRSRPRYAVAFRGDPLVTVRIGTYQGGRVLCERALASVRRQTYSHWEAVVVGDGCTDDTAERVADLADPRITFHNRPVNGPYPQDTRRRWQVAGSLAFNEAADRAQGRWIAPLDQDDEWDDDHLLVLLRTAQQARAELVYGRMRAILEDSGDSTWFGEWPPRHGDFGFQAALYHADLRDFRYQLAAADVDEPADWHLARRMWEAGVRFHFLPRSVGSYHVGADSPSLRYWRERVLDRGLLPAPPSPELPPGLAEEIGRLLARVTSDFGGGCSRYKAEVMAELVVGERLAAAVDIGVYRGRSLLPLAAAFRWQGSGVAVGIDPYSAGAAVQSDAHALGPVLVEWAHAQDWDGLHRGVLALIHEEGLGDVARILRQRSDEAAAGFGSGTLDLVHIDGNHDADAVAGDLARYRPLVRPGGYVVLDDVSWESVRPVYDDLCRSAHLVREHHTEVDDFAVFRLPPPANW